MISNDSKLIEISCKEFLMDIVKESVKLNNKLSFYQKTILYDKIKEMKYEKVIGLLFNEGVEVTSEQKREFESGMGKYTKYAVAGAVGRKLGHVATGSKTAFFGGYKTGQMAKGGIKGALAGVAALFLFRKLSEPCVRQNLGNKPAQLKCRMEAIKRVISQIKSDIGKCSGAKDPIKCKQKLNNELIKWKTKYEQLLVELTKYNRKK